jgi:hypothetical protein
MFPTFLFGGKKKKKKIQGKSKKKKKIIVNHPPGVIVNFFLMIFFLSNFVMRPKWQIVHRKMEQKWRASSGRRFTQVFLAISYSLYF